MDHRQVRCEIGLVHQIGEIGQQLAGREHALVDHDLGRQAADVEHLGLSRAVSPRKQMARPLANQIQLPFEVVALQRLPCESHPRR